MRRAPECTITFAGGQWLANDRATGDLISVDSSYEALCTGLQGRGYVVREECSARPTPEPKLITQIKQWLDL